MGHGVIHNSVCVYMYIKAYLVYTCGVPWTLQVWLVRDNSPVT